MKLLVIGGCNVDFNVKPVNEVIEKNSNISDITINLGGVGKNIAENLKNMGNEVTFITSAGKDFLFNYVHEEFNNKGINAKVIIKEKTGAYIALINSNGTLNTAFCDMKSIESISLDDILKLDLDLTCFDGVIMDANLSEELLLETCKYLRRINVPFALETVSNDKCSRVMRTLNDCILIKPNMFEAEIITKRSCRTFDDVQSCGKILNSMGVKNVIISMGKDGFYFYSNNFQKHFKIEKDDVIDVTGAGDALISAAFIGLLLHMEPEVIGNIAAKCAAITCKCTEPVSGEILPDIFEI